MYYVAENSSKTLKLDLHKDHMYGCVKDMSGKEVASLDFPFVKDSYSSFLSVYYIAVHWAKDNLDKNKSE